LKEEATAGDRKLANQGADGQDGFAFQMEKPRAVMEAACVEFEPFIDERVRQFIISGIDYYSIAATGLPDYFPINFVLRAERGDVLGGLLGQLQLIHLWVAETARGAGYGTRLIKDAESYPRSRGAIGATVESAQLSGPAIL
jgi:GNAT superfamily N-acetyltransferase